MVTNESTLDFVIARPLLHGDFEVDEVALASAIAADGPTLIASWILRWVVAVQRTTATNAHERGCARFVGQHRSALHRWTEIPDDLRLTRSSQPRVTPLMSQLVPASTGYP